jgi:hypothetical protein
VKLVGLRGHEEGRRSSPQTFRCGASLRSLVLSHSLSCCCHVWRSNYPTRSSSYAVYRWHLSAPASGLFLLAASRPKRSWPGGLAGASRMCDSCSRRCSRRCSTRAASTCESGRIVKLKGLVYVAAFGLLLGLLGELQRRCFTITAAGTTTTVGRRSSHSGRVHHILLPRVIGVVASGIEALGPEKPSPTRQGRAEPPQDGFAN